MVLRICSHKDEVWEALGCRGSSGVAGHIPRLQGLQEGSQAGRGCLWCTSHPPSVLLTSLYGARAVGVKRSSFAADPAGRHFDAVIRLELQKISAYFTEKEKELEVGPC